MEPDFSGYVTKAGLKCTDGRTITPEAFKHQDQMTVPLVWQHGHSDPNNVLGHVDLEARDSTHPDGAGVYGYGYLNDAPQGLNAKTLVQHGDVTRMSIWANDLLEKSKQVLHGAIREVSLVLAGANPGAVIDYVRVQHSADPNDVEILADEAIITTGLDIETPTTRKVVEDEAALTHSAAGDGPTAQEVYDSLNQDQKDLLSYMVSAAVEEAGGVATHSDLDPDAQPQEIYDGLSDNAKIVVHSMIEAAVEEAKTTAVAEHSALNNQEGMTVTNVFESQGGKVVQRPTLSHDQLKTVLNDAQEMGSLKNAFLAHAGDFGIDNIDLLFPDATMDGNGISVISRRMEWVNTVLTQTKHSPFSRIKSLAADLTADEARAKGYVKGNLKKDEVIKMLRRITTPKTIYKKQKLDRDDIVDITDLDIVAWLKAEMRVMLDEELARAILVSDGRDADDEDKIDEDHIRPIAYDIDMYNTKVPLPPDFTPGDFIDAVVTARKYYKGTGQPTMFTTTDVVTPLILAKDGVGRRLYNTMQELAAALRVDAIVEVEAMEQDSDLVAVVVNLADYTVGSDRGGAVSMFDDFDIDYNQQKYLIETRVSGALTKPKSALTFTRDSGRVVTPAAPTFVAATGVLTVPAQTGVVYHNDDTGAVLPTGPQAAVAPGATFDVSAAPANGYGFAHDTDTSWSFTRDA